MCVDNNADLWGRGVLPGLVCSSPEELTADKIDTVVITPESGYVI